jgi:hypothetical protein
LVLAILAGVDADLTWRFRACGITPLPVGGPLQPAAPVSSVFGFSGRFWGEVSRALAGVFCYPLR